MKICSLMSGSAGNCQYIETKKSKILIDVGISGKRAKNLLDSIDINIDEIDAILVTHEHLDHVQGVGVLARRYGIPVYANQETHEAMKKIVKNLPLETVKIFETGKYFNIKDIDIMPMMVSHDAVEPVSFILNSNSKKGCVITDTGFVSEELEKEILNCNIVYLESNYDEFMLKNGSYPINLKKRILSNYGHMDNRDSADILRKILRGNNEVVLLGHLSKENNTEELAYKTTHDILGAAGLDAKNEIRLDVTHRYTRTSIYEV